MQSQLSDITFMKRCLYLAQKGSGKVAPNPMVGCVIVHNHQIIGEGYHQEYGGPHAEVNAVNSVKDKNLLKEAVFYVSLEPCAHYGKTPPCALLLSEIKPKKVVIACQDAFAKVNGKGVEMLKAQGIEVQVGVLEKEALELNKRFFTFHQHKRPYIVLKWAESADGFISKNNEPTKISNDICDFYTQKRRWEESAIMVGPNTLKRDNPKLSSRLHAKNLIRIAIDHRDGVDPNYHFLDGSQPSILFGNNSYKELPELSVVPLNQLNDCLQYLYEQNITSVLVEGGSALLQELIDKNLFDEVFFYKNPSLFLKEGTPAPVILEAPWRIKKMGNQLKYYFCK